MNNKPRFVGERRRVKLSDICSKGKSSLRQKDVNNDGPYAVYGAPGIIGTMGEYQNEAPYVAVIKDGAGVGRANACEAKTSVLGTMQALLPNSNVERDYLLHLVRSLHLGKDFSGSTIPHIYFKDYGKLEVPLPPVDIQKQIVSQFNAIERQIAQIETQIAQLDQLVKSRFVEMFGTSQTPSFEVVPLEQVCAAIVDCPHQTPKYQGELTYPAIRTSELVGTSIDWTTMKYVSEDEYLLRTKRLKPEPGDVVYAREGVYGTAAILPEGYQFCLGQRTMLYRPNYKLCTSSYLLHALTSDDVMAQADKLNIGSTVPHVNVKDAKRFRIMLPPLPLQQDFAAFAAQVDKTRAIAQQQVDKLQTLYDSLAQDYFS